jgi:cobalt/nickel transport system permease protein
VIAERFSEGNSIFHTLDPRIKVGLAIPYVFTVALTDKLVVSALALLLSIVFILLTGLSFRVVAQSLKVFLIFIVLLWIILPWSIPGRGLYTLGPLSLSMEGVTKTLSITLRSTSILLLILSLVSTSSVFSIVHALDHFRVPQKLVYLLFLSYRYIYVIYAEYLRLRDAMRIRGFKPSTDAHTYKTFGYLIGMILIRSFERSERIYNAMLCRGFQGKFFLLDHFKIMKKDIIMLIVLIIPLLGIGWLEWISKIL